MKMLTKEEAAAEIADFDYQVDEGTQAIYRILALNEDDPDEPLKLLKVNSDTPAAGIMPLHFPPKLSQGMAFAYELVVITPEEFDDLRAGRLSLFDGWQLGRRIEAPRRLAEAVA